MFFQKENESLPGFQIHIPAPESQALCSGFLSATGYIFPTGADILLRYKGLPESYFPSGALRSEGRCHPVFLPVPRYPLYIRSNTDASFHCRRAPQSAETGYPAPGASAPLAEKGDPSKPWSHHLPKDRKSSLPVPDRKTQPRPSGFPEPFQKSFRPLPWSQ